MCGNIYWEMEFYKYFHQWHFICNKQKRTSWLIWDVHFFAHIETVGRTFNEDVALLLTVCSLFTERRPCSQMLSNREQGFVSLNGFQYNLSWETTPNVTRKWSLEGGGLPLAVCHALSIRRMATKNQSIKNGDCTWRGLPKQVSPYRPIVKLDALS